MKRQDEGLAFMLRYDNIARFEDGEVLILDRRIYPEKKEFVNTYVKNCPLGCWANEDDIKGPVVFLASEASRYVTGATLVMDGGWTIW